MFYVMYTVYLVLSNLLLQSVLYRNHLDTCTRYLGSLRSVNT